VAGFGNERPNYLDLVGLTTVAQSFSDLGRLAGELLLERLSTPADPHRVYREVLLPMSLVVRSSSGPHAPSS
jgi:DNA-binding LacI/PurR family transcriptional regulator